MRRRVYLHGQLKKIASGPIEVEADTVAEAIKAITLQLPGFRPNAVTGRKRIQVRGCPSVESLFAPNDMEEIHIFPQFNGGKSGGFLQILIGVALIAAAVFFPGALGALAPLLFKVGAMMIIGGLLSLISAPKRDKSLAESTQNKTYYLGAPKNTVDIGTRIPILYGKRKVGGQYLAFNISAVN